MTTTKSANDILMGGGGAPRAKFATIGDSVTGRITHISEPYQEREYDPNNPGGGAPKFYPKSGDPIMTFNVDLATDQRDPSIDEDDGTRRVYMDGKRIKDAVRAAVRAANAPGLQVGGTLTIAYVGDEVPGDARSGKQYQVSYVSATNAALMGDATPAQQTAPVMSTATGTPVVHQQAVPTPAPAATPQPQPVQQAQAAPAAPGMTPEQWAAFQQYQAQQQAQAS